MRIMVTGSRAPVALDLMRGLASQGHQVFSADSMIFPLSRWSKSVFKHIVLPVANTNPNRYYQALKTAIQHHAIDYLIPTCEEIFFISRFHKKLSQYCHLFLDPLEQLAPLHNKYQFAQLCQDSLIQVPESYLIRNQADKHHLPSYDLVLKPLFSRFGSQVLIKPDAQEIQKLDCKLGYIAQRFIEGTEYCSYALAFKGQLLCHASYQPKYKAGVGAAIYFEPADLSEIKTFITHLVAKINFTGHISFDFIRANDGLFVLECNPRATSGLHFLAQEINWLEIMHGIPQTVPIHHQAKMLKFAMLSYGVPRMFDSRKSVFWQDYVQAIDVLKADQDKWMHLKSMPTMIELFIKSIVNRKSFTRTTTHDIEWMENPYDSIILFRFCINLSQASKRTQ